MNSPRLSLVGLALLALAGCAPVDDAAPTASSSFIPWDAFEVEREALTLAMTGAPGEGLPTAQMPDPTHKAVVFQFERDFAALGGRLGLRTRADGSRVRRATHVTDGRVWFFGYLPANDAALQLVASHPKAPVSASVLGCRTADGRELRGAPATLAGCTHYLLTWDPHCNNCSCPTGYLYSEVVNACVPTTQSCPAGYTWSTRSSTCETTTR